MIKSECVWQVGETILVDPSTGYGAKSHWLIVRWVVQGKTDNKLISKHIYLFLFYNGFLIKIIILILTYIPSQNAITPFKFVIAAFKKCVPTKELSMS